MKIGLTKKFVWRSFYGLTKATVTELKKRGYTHIRHGAIVSNDGVIYNKTVGKINGLYTNTSVNINQLKE